MQFPNNQDGQNSNRRLIIIVVFGLLITMGVVFLFTHKPKKSTTTQTSPGAYYDPGSGETVSNPPGKAPENPDGTLNDDPIFLGFDKLLNRGVTASQLEAIKLAFIAYSKDGDKKIQEISMTVKSINRDAPNKDTGDERDIVSFEVTIDRKQVYKARVESQSYKVSRLYLSDSSGKQVFDSYDVDGEVSD